MPTVREPIPSENHLQSDTMLADLSLQVLNMDPKRHKCIMEFFRRASRTELVLQPQRRVQ